MTTDPVRHERRSGQRFQLHVPLTIHVEGRTVPGFTQDLSSRGLFLFSEAELPEGTPVELTFTMPSEITLGDSMRVRGRGRVVRSDGSRNGPRQGVAVQLGSYEYLPAAENDAAAELARVSAAEPLADSSEAFSR